MYAPLPAAVKPVRILFLSREESSVRMDVKSFRALGTTDITHLRDAVSAIAFLQKERKRCLFVEKTTGKRPQANIVDLVVCDELLQDGPASVFLYALAREEGMRSQPVLVLASSAASAKALRAADVYVLERPYSSDDLDRMAQKAMSPMRRLLRGEAFEQAEKKRSLPIRPKEKSVPLATDSGASAQKARVLTVSDWYNKGMGHFRVDELREAEQAFLTVLHKQEEHVEAMLGLARVYRAQENAKKAMHCLVRAAACCLRGGERERAEAIAGQLPERMRNDIYLHEAVAGMEDGRYRSAALSLLDASRDGEGRPLHTVVARACLLTEQPDASMENVCDAFERMDHKATAVTLRRRLLTYQPFKEREPSSWLDRFPLLKEAVCVASYTAWAWKH